MIMGGSLSDAELTDPALPLPDIAWRLFHEEEEIRAFSPVAIRKGCRCDPDHIRSVLSRVGVEERKEMADERGVIAVDCAFCSKIFDVALDDFPSIH